MIKTYKELSTFCTFEERFNYLKLCGSVGKETFGFDRIYNQMFYNRSIEWKSVRHRVIIRDNGCDLGISGHDICGRIIVHHMNPISLDDIENATDFLLNPEYLICVSHNTHNALHYGNEKMLFTELIERCKNDTCPWKM